MGLKVRTGRRNKHLESHEQFLFFKEARYWLPEKLSLHLWSSMSGEKLRSKRQASQAQNQGNIKGIPDICFAWPRLGYHGLYIELKRPANKALGVRKGEVKPEQKAMLRRLNEAGYLAVAAWGSEEAMSILRRYMTDSSPLDDVQEKWIHKGEQDGNT